MDGESSIARNCVIITTLVMPCIVVAFVPDLCGESISLCGEEALCLRSGRVGFVQ